MDTDSDSSEDERQVITLPSGKRITLAEYEKIHLRMPGPYQPRDNGRQTLVPSNEQPRPVQRVPPMKTQVSQQDNGPSRLVEPQSAKMLIFLPNGAQRLITFTLPKESCTLQEVLEQVKVPFSGDSHIQCMQNTSSEIDYFVSVDSTSRIEDLLENHPMLVGNICSSEMSTLETTVCPENSRHSPESPHTPRYVIGKLAVCKLCGYTGLDFRRCERCKRLFTEEPKSVPITSKKVEQKKDPEKNNSSDGKILNLLKTAVGNLNNKTLEMDSDNSESGDDESNQNGRFDEHQITQILTCLKEVINILYRSLKKNRKKRKHKKLFQKETKTTEVYDARNEIQKLCRTIRHIGLSRSSLVCETSSSNTPAAAGTSSHTESMPGTSRSCIEPVTTETSKNHKIMAKSHTNALTGTQTQTQEVAGTSRSTDAISGTSKCHTEAINITPGSHTEVVLRTSISQMETVATSRNLIEATAGNSRRNSEPTAGTSVSHPEATIPNSSILPEATVEPSRLDTEAISVASRNQIEAVPGPSTSRDPIMTETSKNDRKRPTKTSTSHIDPTVTETSKHHENRPTETSTSQSDPTVTETSKSDRKGVTETCTSHTNPTVTETPKIHRKRVTETSTSQSDPTVTETSKNDRKRPTKTSTSHIDPTVTETSKHHENRPTETSTSQSDPTVTETSKSDRKGVTETCTSHTNPTVTESSKNHKKSVTETCTSHTDPSVTETSKTDIKRVTETCTSHTDPTVTELSKNHKKSVTETCTSHTEAPVSETSKNQTKEVQHIHTNPVLVTPKTHTELETDETLKSQPKVQDPETSQTFNPGNNLGVSIPTMADTINSSSSSVFPETPRRHTQADTQTPGSRTEPVGARISSTHTNSIVTKTKKSRTQSASGILKSHTEPVVTLKKAVPGTSRSHAEAKAENSKNHAEAKETAISHTKDMNSEPSVRSAEAVDPINSLSKFEQDLAGIPNGHSKSVHRKSSIHIEAVSGTSRNNPEAVGAVVTDANTRENKKDMLCIPKSNLRSVKPVDTWFETLKNHVDAIIRGVTKDPTEMKLSKNKRNQTNVAVSETSNKQITNVNVRIRDDDVRNKESTNIHVRSETNSDEMDNNTTAAKRNTATSLKRNHANSNHDDPKRSRLDSKCSCKKSICNDNLRQHCTHHVIKHNKENYENSIHKLHKRQDNINTSEAQNGRVTKEKKSAETKKRTSRSESTPNGHIEQPMTNLTLKRVSDIDISRKQADAKERKAKRSNSTPNSHFERADATTLGKITNSDKDNNKSSDERKSKSTTETYAPNGRIADAEKAKKAEDGKKSKAQKEKDSQGMDKPDSTLNRQIEEANSTLANTTADKENKPADVKTKTETKSNFMAKERIEEFADSTLTKIVDTDKTNKPSDGKKRKASKSESGPFKKTMPYSTIDLTSDNDEDELKLPTTAVKECIPKSAENDKEINDQQTIDISEDTLYEPTEKDAKSMTAIKKYSPKLADKDEVLKEEKVIDIDEDTCSYDPAQEKTSVMIKTSSPKTSTGKDQILKDQQVIDISEDTCLYSPSEERTSTTTKKPSPKTETEVKICRLDGEKASVTNQESNKNINEYRKKLIKELEEKHAAELLAANVKKEQAGNQMDSNSVVVSSFFRPQSNQKSNEDHKSTEQKKTNIKQGLQEKSLKNRHDKALKSKKTTNKLNHEKVLPEVTITTKTPDASNLPTNQQAPQIDSNSTEKRSNVPVIIPELSISILPTPITQVNPNLTITGSMYSALIQQSAQIARSDLSIATSGTAPDHTESRPEKPNSVKALKHPSSESGPFPKRDAVIKPKKLKTNPIEKKAQPNQTVTPRDSEWRSIPLTKLISSNNAGTSSNNNSNSAHREQTKAVSETTIQKTSYAPADLAPRDLNSRRGENTSNVQSPQIYWYKSGGCSKSKLKCCKIPI